MQSALKLTRIQTPKLQKLDIQPRYDSALSEFIAAMGWRELPGELIDVILEDIKGFYNEVTGLYCSRDEFVLNRRRSVIYWIDCYRKNLCSLDTAISMLKLNY
ncbi:MAG: hypothetical protein EA364_10650 [Balneolaceae bacterium]|nr:MAG: hypothetical protein EA364_10650 [Balneolaceae bacterium]